MLCNLKAWLVCVGNTSKSGAIIHIAICLAWGGGRQTSHWGSLCRQALNIFLSICSPFCFCYLHFFWLEHHLILCGNWKSQVQGILLPSFLPHPFLQQDIMLATLLSLERSSRLLQHCSEASMPAPLEWNAVQKPAFGRAESKLSLDSLQ